MKYASAKAFRDALESRLKTEATTDGVVNSALLGRLRKRLTFERFLARLHQVAPGAWVLKGGFALEVRLGSEARTTKDMDVDWLTVQEDAIEHLLDAASAELGDYFEFEIEREGRDPEVDAQGQRWKVKASLAGRTFENVSLDIGAGAPVVPTETLSLPAMLDFAGLTPVKVPSLSIEQHLAEKVHAYTRLYGEKQKATSRVKDLVDMALVAVALEPRAKELDRGLHKIFDRRQAHSLPFSLPSPSRDWGRQWRKLAADLPIPESPEGGHGLAAKLLDPILRGETKTGVWDPNHFCWARGREVG